MTAGPDPLAVRWPEGHAPQGADIHVVNRATSAAGAQEIWAWLVRPELWGRYYANARLIRPQAGAWPTLETGSRFRWLTFGALVSTTVTECEPLQRLAWSGGGLGSVGHHAWVISERGPGETLITTEETQRGTPVRLLAPVLRPAMLHWHQRWADALARIAETGPPPRPARP